MMRKITAEQIQQERDEQAARAARAERDRLLAETDHTQLPDAPFSDLVKQEYAEKRQALRDVPLQSGFPHEVQWPEFPRK